MNTIVERLEAPLQARRAHPVVSVVIGSFNRRRLPRQTIESVRSELEGVECEILIVDGGSTDGTTKWLLNQRDVITIVQHNRGAWSGRPVQQRSWGYFMNLGFMAAHGKYVCMLSDDCLVVPDAIKNGLRLFEQKLEAGHKLGAVAFYFRDWPGEESVSCRSHLGRPDVRQPRGLPQRSFGGCGLCRRGVLSLLSR